MHLFALYARCCGPKTLIASQWLRMRFSTTVTQTFAMRLVTLIGLCILLSSCLSEDLEALLLVNLSKGMARNKC